MTEILGTMRRLDERRGAVRVEDVYDTDVADLWSAITEPDRLARWIAVVEGDLRIGGVVQARFTSSWEGPGRIDVCDPPNRLVLTMEPGTDDEAVIEALLTEEGERTRLVIEERGLPLDVLYGHGAGWQAHIEDLVATSLEANRTGSRAGWNSRRHINRSRRVRRLRRERLRSTSVVVGELAGDCRRPPRPGVGRLRRSTRSRNAVIRVNASIRFPSFSTVCPSSSKINSSHGIPFSVSTA